MGCMGSRLLDFLRSQLDFRDRALRRHQNVYSVLNVDEMGRHISPGKLEVTETELVLHIRGKNPLSWPLRCLRRYGYEEELFSFESGRRCPTGPGIYAFKCSQAQSLFNLLQARIQGNLVNNATTNPSTPITPTTTNFPASSLSPTFDYVNINDNRNEHDSKHLLASREDDDHPLYMNVESTIIYPPPPRTRQFSKNCVNLEFDHHSPSNSSAYYTNVDCNSSSFAKESAQVNYAELDLEPDKMSKSTIATAILHPSSPLSSTKNLSRQSASIDDPFCDEIENMEPPKGKQNGHSSNLNSNRGGSAKVNNSSGESAKEGNSEMMGYATIDFVRTAALNNIVTRSKIKLDFNESPPSQENHPVKKSRHNSTAL